MRMVRRIKGVTVKDKMKSEDIRKELGVGSIKSKARESRLRWFGHVHRRKQESNLRQVMDMEIPGRRPRGRPRGRCGNCGWCQKMQTTETFGDDGSGAPTPPRDKAREERRERENIFPAVHLTNFLKSIIISFILRDLFQIGFHIHT